MVEESFTLFEETNYLLKQILTEKCEEAKNQAAHELGQSIQVYFVHHKDKDSELGQKHKELVSADVKVVMVGLQKRGRGRYLVDLDHEHTHAAELEDRLKVLNHSVVPAIFKNVLQLRHSTYMCRKPWNICSRLTSEIVDGQKVIYGLFLDSQVQNLV